MLGGLVDLTLVSCVGFDGQKQNISNLHYALTCFLGKAARSKYACYTTHVRVVLYSFIYKPSLGRPCAKLARRLRDSGFWINQCLRYHELGHTAQEEKKKQQEKKTNKEKEKKNKKENAR